ncbi:MAG: type II toxin-antitoxin system HicB family antitoxin [Rhizonema sp. PD37]|nr:type II toxin-antitoxin system HicB family antitoxin [Rhizonema sp. PD37]
METIINLRIERLPEGIYLGTSDELQGLVAQGRTIAETLKIARDVARKLLEAQSQDHLSSFLLSWLPWQRTRCSTGRTDSSGGKPSSELSSETERSSSGGKPSLRLLSARKCPRFGGL